MGKYVNFEALFLLEHFNTCIRKTIIIKIMNHCKIKTFLFDKKDKYLFYLIVFKYF